MNEAIKGKLKKKGFNFSGGSEAGKSVRRFEEIELSKSLYTLFYDNPIYRVIAQKTFEKGISQIFETTQDIVKLNLKELISPPLRKLICDHCNHKITTFEKEHKPVFTGLKCPSCHHKQTRLEDDWDITVREVVDYFNVLSNRGVAQKFFSTACPDCFKIDYIEKFSYDDFVKNKVSKKDLSKLLFCANCKGSNEIVWGYLINEYARNLWTSGSWLEWYIKNILEDKLKIRVEQGVLIKDEQNKNQIEVDSLFLNKSKIFSVECKALSLDKRADESDVKDVVKLFDFSDRIIFVTTTNVGENLKERYKRLFGKRFDGKLIFVEGKEIENLPNILKPYI